MALYSVCSLIIQSDLLTESFSPFKVSNAIKPNNLDMKIRRVDHTHMNPKANMTKVASLKHVNVWKHVNAENKTHWVFELLNHMGTVSADEQYSDIEVYGYDFDGAIDEIFISKIFAPCIQIVLECKLIATGFSILHSACVGIEGKAYAFTGASGTGKSTRAGNWCRLLNAEWISGDRPAINVQEGFAYGVPWDGKEGIYRNYHCPLKAILKVNRSENTYIQEITEREKMQLLCEQTMIPMWDPMLVMQAMRSIKILIKNVPIYDVFCDITDESTLKTYQIVSNTIRV